MEWWILIITIKKGRDRGASIVFSDVREGDKSIASCIISVYRVGVRWGGGGECLERLKLWVMGLEKKKH